MTPFQMLWCKLSGQDVLYYWTQCIEQQDRDLSREKIKLMFEIKQKKKEIEKVRRTDLQEAKRLAREKVILDLHCERLQEIRYNLKLLKLFIREKKLQGDVAVMTQRGKDILDIIQKMNEPSLLTSIFNQKNMETPEEIISSMKTKIEKDLFGSLNDSTLEERVQKELSDLPTIQEEEESLNSAGIPHTKDEDRRLHIMERMRGIQL